MPLTALTNQSTHEFRLRWRFMLADVVALGAVQEGTIEIQGVDGEDAILERWGCRGGGFVVEVPAAGISDPITISLGRTSPNYDDYVVESDGKAAAGTMFGATNASAGVNNTMRDVPSFTQTTKVYLKFKITGTATLDQLTACQGIVTLIFMDFYE